MLSAFCCCGFCRDASGQSMTRFMFSAASFHWGHDHPNALARKVKFFFKRGVARPRHNAWTSDRLPGRGTMRGLLTSLLKKNLTFSGTPSRHG